MGFLSKLFGGKEEPEKPAPVPAVDPQNDPNLIRAFDSYGREIFITRNEWRDNVLLGNIKKSWSDPAALYDLILSALNDGFRADVVDAAKHLHEIDPEPARGACMYGIVLMEEDRLDESEKVFTDHMRRYGEDAYILTNLAKVQAKRQNMQLAEQTLWRALELDPNQDNGVLWYEALAREKGGESAGKDALQKIAALPGSWRAQLWLARAALVARDLDQALMHYRAIVAAIVKPAPPDLLAQMSGDLGNHGHLPELLQLVEPHFIPEVHGIHVGNNLIKAHLDLGQMEDAQQIMNQLYALKRPDWRDVLGFWDHEIAKTRVATSSPEQPESLEMTMLAIQGPIWLPPSSPAAELFPAKVEHGPVISLLGSSADIATNSQRVQHQMSDAVGRMTRALPLFFAEQLDFGSTARVRALVPWIAGKESGGFLLSGGPWSEEDAAAHARQAQEQSEYVLTIHIQAQAEPWTCIVNLIQIIDGKCLGKLEKPFPWQHPEEVMPGFARQIVQWIAEKTGAEITPHAPGYHVPKNAHFSDYLLRLEQLLAVRCAALGGGRAGALSGEREIIDGNIQLCLSWPDISSQILLAQTLVSMKKVRPDILPEFREKVALLQKDKPLAEPANSVVQRMIDRVFLA